MACACGRRVNGARLSGKDKLTVVCPLLLHEDLERDDILAALSYAARLTHVKRLERLAA